MNKSVEFLKLPKIEDPRGNLTYIEQENHIPFGIKRVYWIYDVPGGQIRGGHAFREQQEFVVALSGSFDVIVNDGSNEKRFHLNRSYYGLYIPNGLWRTMDNFSTNSVALVLSSTFFNEGDYIRDLDNFKIFKKI
jgi:dTDP-4-dehydrorhamnose 3,5-epimerase-like enzyme